MRGGGRVQVWCQGPGAATPDRLCPAADPSHGEQPGAEEVVDGSGYLHEDGGLSLHRHLLRGTFPRGEHSWDCPFSQALNSHSCTSSKCQGFNLHLDTEICSVLACGCEGGDSHQLTAWSHSIKIALPDFLRVEEKCGKL